MHLQMVIVWLLHPKENAGALPAKSNCFRSKEKKGWNYFSGTCSFWIGKTVLLLKTVRWKSNGALDYLCSILRTGSHCSEPTLFSGGHRGVSGGCQINLGMNGLPTTKEQKARGLIPQRESGPGEKDIQHSTSLTAFLPQKKPLLCFSIFF